jgi:hypothetical protein
MIDVLDRRSLLRSVMLLAGVAAAPGTAHALFAGPQALPPSTMTLLTAVADTMIPATDTPGALAVGVPQAFGKLLANWASPSRRAQLLAALQAIDTKAGGFARLSPSARLEMLTAHDKASAAPPVAVQLKDEKDTGAAGGMGYTEDAKTKAQDPTPDYAKLKELLVTLYYLTEIGSTVELRYEHNPGVWEPSIPVTAETRNYGGPGGL